VSTVPDGGAILPVDKPAGWSSHDVVARARKTLDTRRIGHTGTLDPFATGLLLLCVGPITRLAEYLIGLDKEYEAIARLGVSTTSHDTEGEVTDCDEGWRHLERAEIERAVGSFVGVVEQRPPAFSAKKVGGEAAHRRVRRGERVELAPVEVTVHELEVARCDLPEVHLRARVSSGTYVRALARDLGKALGVGAHLTALRRTRIGRFHVDDALPGLALERGSAELGNVDATLDASWIAPTRALGHLAAIDLERDAARRLATGQSVPVADAVGQDGRVPEEDPEAPIVARLDGTLFAIVQRSGSSVRPRKVFGRLEG